MAGDLAVWLLILSILSRKKRAAQSCCSWSRQVGTSEAFQGMLRKNRSVARGQQWQSVARKYNCHQPPDEHPAVSFRSFSC